MRRITSYFLHCTLATLFFVVGQAQAQQTVFLDFDSGTQGGAIVYTQQMRDDVQALFEGHYAAWDFTFVQSAPGAGDFSTVTFNSGGAGGLAQHIDFRNVDKNDTAVVNINGLGFTTTADIVSASAIIGSHELGHLQGLRHGDSYGPIGSGIHSPPGSGSYLPAYPGPNGANETTDHIMASPGSVGQSLNDVTTPSWFSERSAVKLTFNEDGTVTAEQGGAHGSIGTAQAVTLDNMIVPNTIVSGANAGAGPAFSVDAFVVSGQIGVGGEQDFYSFAGSAGDLMNFEVISSVINDRLFDTIDSQISVFDAGGSLINYYGSTAFNDDEFESLDSILIDLILPSDGTYFVAINAFSAADIGAYELFGYRFNGAVPEPGSFGVAAVCGVIGFVVYRRRRKRAAA